MSNRIGWEDLPQDLLILLVERLIGITSFIRVSAVCSYWHSIFKANSNCYKQVPWIMLCETDGTDIREFYDIATNEVYEFPLPQVQERRTAGSAHGWLVTAGLDAQFRLFNPLTGVEIDLPPQSAFENEKVMREIEMDNGEIRTEEFFFSPEFIRKLFMTKATLSPNPSDNYAVMATYTGFDTYCLAFCRSNDKVWTRFKKPVEQREVAFVRGQFYSIDLMGNVFACDISTPTPALEEITSLTFPRDEDWMHYMVECNGELLVVMRFIEEYETGDGSSNVFHTEDFKVFRLDLEAKKAIKIESIGDYALFLGLNNSICVPVPTTWDCQMLRRNSIYFLDDDHEVNHGGEDKEVGEDMGIFSLDDGSIQPHYPGLSKSSFSMPIWFTPNL